MSPTDRWPAILLQLQADAWQRATDLAAALGVSTRTIYRDMQALEAAGVPIRAVRGKGYQLEDDYLLDPVPLTTDEAVVLLVGAASIARQTDATYRAAARSAQARLKEQLSDSDQAAADALQHHLHGGSEAAFGPAVEDRVLDVLRQALLEARAIRFHEQASDARPTIAMNPYGLVRQSTDWHLIGYVHEDERVRSVSLDCITDPELLETTFERPAGYRSHVEAADGLPDQTVRVLFAPEVSGSVQAPPSLDVESTEQRPDGRLMITLQVRRQQAVVSWLLSWGSHAHVLEPAELRKRIAQEARQIADQYREAPRLIE